MANRRCGAQNVGSPGKRNKGNGKTVSMYEDLGKVGRAIESIAAGSKESNDCYYSAMTAREMCQTIMTGDTTYGSLARESYEA